MASVKYEAGIQKNTAVLLGDPTRNQNTVMCNTKKSERSQADVHCRNSSVVSEEVSSKHQDKTGLMNVLTSDDITLASSGVPTKPEGIASGRKALILQVQSETKGDRLKRKIVITNGGYTVYSRETVSDSVTGEWSACLGEKCGGTASLDDVIIGYDNGGLCFRFSTNHVKVCLVFWH
ncbi:hypothetical protein DPMN_078334 [Dreissena polymorpha]|uniref:Uncharacterized protein n=1 Tax=Dreissena polymorpha TaxID=45954 RepID=A0A9D3YMH8_DREPO|nr:hypothetical protein DPMN_078334 [Dreissena polymorpha]